MEHLLNLFQISNQNQLSLNFRLIEISRLPDGKTRPENLQRVKKFVARQYGTPTALIKHNDLDCLAVALETVKQELPVELDVPVLQGLSAHLRLLPDPVQINGLGKLSPEDESIATTFLSFVLRGPLYKNFDLWQGSSAYIYYTKTPVNQECRSRVELYPGFSFRILKVPERGFCLAMDVIHVYTDARTLAQRMTAGEDWRNFVGRHFVYEFGPQWFPIQLQQVANFSISEAHFTPKGSEDLVNVYDYTLDRWRGRETSRLRALRPTDQALIYNYPGRSDQFQAAVTLARLRYRTDDPEVGSLHKLTVLEPEERLRRIQEAIEDYLDGKAFLNGQPIQVSQKPVSVPRKFFSIPAQLFGHGNILPAPKQEAQAIREMWRTRFNWLRDKEIGFLTREGITNQFILFPMSIAEDEPLMDRIKDDLMGTTNDLSPVSYHPTPVIWDDRDVRTIPQLKQALSRPKQQMEHYGAACAVVVLPSKWPRKQVSKLRRHAKKLLHPVKTKCVQGSEMLRHLEVKNGAYQVVQTQANRYRKYLYYTALDVLVISGFWPWALANPLHYDLYVGIDVLNGIAGLTFVADSGAICRFQHFDSGQKEKLPADQMAEVLAEHLTNLIPRVKEKNGALPRHIVLYRDGRFYDTEKEGLDKTKVALLNKSLLPRDVQIGVVEIHKSTAQRLRMMAKLDRGQVVNPQMGSYYILDPRRGALCTTGFPGLSRGTADLLWMEIVEGDLDIEKVLQDGFGLSLLAWNRPDGVQRNPLAIKLDDDWLESIAAETSEDEELLSTDEEDNSDLE